MGRRAAGGWGSDLRPLFVRVACRVSRVGGGDMVGAASNSQGSGDGSAVSDSDGLGMAEVATAHFRSQDVDETRAFLGQLGHHIKIPYGRDPFAYELAGAASRSLTAVHIDVAVRQAMRATDSAPMLFLPLRTGYAFNIGRKAWQPDPSRAILIAPDHEYSAQAPAGAFLGLRGCLPGAALRGR